MGVSDIEVAFEDKRPECGVVKIVDVSYSTQKVEHSEITKS